MTVRRVLVVVLVVVLVCCVTLTALRHHEVRRSAELADALEAARARIPALLSYSSEGLEADLEAAKGNTTGRFATEFAEELDTVVRPRAMETAASNTAAVSSVAVIGRDGDDVTVLVLVTQTTERVDQTTPAVTTSRVVVTMREHDDAWLVAGLATA